ncbi:hypothetical protein G6F50_018113 [Rhizopus delemar]|uniref:Uncharacterized protein n=1 Tax=Rhizopus delemar TaxID=936053 RepID=A0A9P6XNP6_9FUNG|nr:hypothetical protein G6F50_018113 [Rhizopus delemar]
MGAEAVYELLRTIDLQSEMTRLREEIAATADRSLPGIGQPSGMDGHDRAAGAAAGPASAGSAGRRPLRDLRPERPVPPRHQP